MLHELMSLTYFPKHGCWGFGDLSYVNGRSISFAIGTTLCLGILADGVVVHLMPEEMRLLPACRSYFLPHVAPSL